MPGNNPWQCLWQQHLEDDLNGRCAHAFRSLDQALIPRLMAPRSTESRDIASKIDVPASPNIGLTIPLPFRNRIYGEKDKAYKIGGQSMDLPVRTAAGKAFSNFAVRETDSGSAVADD